MLTFDPPWVMNARGKKRGSGGGGGRWRALPGWVTVNLHLDVLRKSWQIAHFYLWLRDSIVSDEPHPQDAVFVAGEENVGSVMPFHPFQIVALVDLKLDFSFFLLFSLSLSLLLDSPSIHPPPAPIPTSARTFFVASSEIRIFPLKSPVASSVSLLLNMTCVTESLCSILSTGSDSDTFWSKRNATSSSPPVASQRFDASATVKQSCAWAWSDISESSMISAGTSALRFLFFEKLEKYLKILTLKCFADLHHRWRTSFRSRRRAR